MSDGSGSFTSTAYADALARAKQLAAKLSGGGGAASPPVVPVAAPLKRSADSDFMEPDAKRQAAQIADPFGAQLAAMKSQSKSYGSDDGKSEFMMRPGLGSTGGGGGTKTIEMNIPGAKVGLVIGKGGETIRNLQEKSGTKMYILQENMFEERDKPLRIVGEPDLVEHARQLVMDLINDSPPKLDFNKPKTEYGTPMNSGGGGGGPGNYITPPGLETMKFPVPKISVGLIIGKAGDMIKRIQVETGAKVQFDPFNSNLGDMDEQLAIITGKPDQIRKAQIKIEELVETALQGGKAPGGNFGPSGGGGGGKGGGGGGGNWGGGGGGDEDRIPVPVNRVGIVIGKGGETIRVINQQSGAHAEIDRTAPTDGPEKIFVIRGTRQQIEHCKELIQEKINSLPGQFNQSSKNNEYGGGGGGGGYGNYGGQQQQHQQQNQWGDPGMDKNSGGGGGDQWSAYAQYYGGQQQQQQPAAAAGGADYTQQWIVYLRAQGQHEQANQLEQQYKMRQGNGGAPQQPQQPGAPGSNGGPPAAQNGASADYSQQWAEHYRSIGKIAEAEQIENYIKSQKAAAAGGGGGGYPYAGGPGPGYPQQQQHPGQRQMQSTAPPGEEND